MKILFVGEFNHFTTALAGKLVKNGNNAAVYNSNSSKPALGFKYSKYTSDSKYIINVYSIFRPDVVVFTAAFDGKAFLDDLKLVIEEAVRCNIKRVFYLSSTTVYGSGSDIEGIPAEAFPLKPVTNSSRMFAMGEDICRRWQGVSGLNIIILRFGGIYGNTAPDAYLNQIVERVTGKNKVKLPEKGLFSFLHIEDAAEAFLQIVENTFSTEYNISTKETISSHELAEKIKRVFTEYAAYIEVKGTALAECYAGDNGRLKEEYQWWERHHFADEAEAFFEELKKENASRDKNSNAEVSDKKASYIGRIKRAVMEAASRFSIIGRSIEVILFFVVCVYMTNLKNDVELISNVDFIMIYLVVIAVVMTIRESAVSLILAAVFIVNSQVNAGYDLFSAIVNNQTLLLIAQYSILSIAVSYVIQQLKTKNLLQQFEIEEQQAQIRQIEKFSEDNLRTRHFFENQIINYDMSLPRIISMTSRLDTLEPEQMIPRAIDIIAESVEVNDVAVYYIGERGGRMRLAFTKTNQAAILGQSPLTEDWQEILSVLEEDRIYVNTELDEKYPAMASGIKSGDRLSYLIIICNLPFQKMCLDTSNLLTAITALMSAALRRVTQYEEITHETRYLTGTAVLQPEIFRKLCEVRLSDDDVTNGFLCRITLGEDSLVQAAEKLEPMIRENDYMGSDQAGCLYVLLTGTTQAGYQVFEKRLQEKGIICSQVEGDL